MGFWGFNKVFLAKLALLFYFICLLLFGLSSSFDYSCSNLRAFAVLSMPFDHIILSCVVTL